MYFKPYVRKGAEAEQFIWAVAQDVAERLGLESPDWKRRADGTIWTKPPANVHGHLCDKLITIADRCGSRASHLHVGINTESDVGLYISIHGLQGLVKAASDLFPGHPSKGPPTSVVLELAR